MAREMASALTPGAKKHADKISGVLRGVKSKYLHAHTWMSNGQQHEKMCVQRGSAGTDRQEEIMVTTVLPYRKTVIDSAWSEKKTEAMVRRPKNQSRKGVGS